MLLNYSEDKYTNIGSVMQAMGNNMSALEIYNHDLAIRERMQSKEHSNIAESYINIRLLYQTMVNTVYALEMPNHQCLALN